MPCVKMTLTHVLETELVFLSSPETGGEWRLFAQTSLPFSLLRPPSVGVWGSSRCLTQSHLWGRFNTHPAFQNRTEHAFIRSPSQSSRKLRKLCQRRASLRTSGLELWSSRGGSIEESWSNTRPDRCIALERQKNIQRPQGGLVAYESPCLSILSFFSSSK